MLSSNDFLSTSDEILLRKIEFNKFRKRILSRFFGKNHSLERKAGMKRRILFKLRNRYLPKCLVSYDESGFLKMKKMVWFKNPIRVLHRPKRIKLVSRMTTEEAGWPEIGHTQHSIDSLYKWKNCNKATFLIDWLRCLLIYAVWCVLQGSA